MPKSLIIFIAVITVALATGFVLVLPKYHDFKITLLISQQKEAELNSKTAYYSEINKTWQDLKQYEDVLVKVDSAVPQGYSVPVLFNYLQKTAGETGLVLENLTFTEAAGQIAKEIGINLQATGDYQSFKNFLSAIENSSRFFNIKSTKLLFSKEGKFSFNLAISTYSY